VKDAMENMRKEMCVVIKERIFKNLIDKAAMYYERNREKALREA
jgi:hypothetical protein